MARKLYPIPVQPLMDDPHAISLPPAAYGMLHRLCEHYWATACRPLPRDDDQLFAIARAHRPTWRHHKTAILQAFETWRPHAESYWRARENKIDSLSRIQAKGRASAAVKRLEATLEPHTIESASTFHQLAILPRREPAAPPRPQPRDDKPVLTDR